MWINTLIICITHTGECDCICHCRVLNDQCVLQLSDTAGLISHLCTIFNGRFKEETEASQSRAGLSPWEPKSAPGPLINMPSTTTHMFLSPLSACACSLMLTLSHFLIYTLCILPIYLSKFCTAPPVSSYFFWLHLKLCFLCTQHASTADNNQCC